MPSIGKETDIPLGLSSHLPITESRARELARIIATSMTDAEGVPALCELLLGVAPSEIEGDQLEPVELRASSAAMLDSLSRYTASIAAVETFYTFTDEFSAAVAGYMRGLSQTEGGVKNESL